MNREEGMTGDRSKGKPGKRGEHSEQGDDNLKCIALRFFRRIVTYKALHFCIFTTDLPLPVADQTAVL